MIGRIKQLLARILGMKNYLLLISRAYFQLYRWGLLKNQYPENYLVKNLVAKNDHVIDLGANLGYFTIPISRIIGKEGKIWAVEPIPVFNEILDANRKLSPHPNNIQLMPYALGEQDAEPLTMEVPVRNGVIRHGLSAVKGEEKHQQDSVKTYQVTSYNPATLFSDLKKLDFIKCDVEGYEAYVIPQLEAVIKAFLPVLQIEIGPPANRKTIHALLKPMGYEVYGLAYPELVKGPKALEQIAGDFYFVPGNRTGEFEKKMQLTVV